MIKGVIIDFDQTIADTSRVEPYRKSKKWETIKNKYHEITLMPKVDYFLNYLNVNKYLVTIVSNAPRTKYLESMLIHFNIEPDIVIGYEDTFSHKPHAEPMILALNKMQLKPHEVISIGDQINDVRAATKANIKSVYYSKVNDLEENLNIGLVSIDYFEITEFIKNI